MPAHCVEYPRALHQSSAGLGQSQPDYSSESSTIVPTGAAFIDAAGPAQLAVHLVYCSYAGGMRIVAPGSPHAVVQPGPTGRRLAVTESLDHAVCFSDTQTIYRVV